MKYKIAGMIFDFASYIPLALPMYRARIEGSFGYDMIVRGFNFVEFSPWGSLMVSMPIVLFALTYLRIKNKFKNLLLILFYMLNTVTVYNATSAADKWVRGATEGFVLFRPYILLYLISMVVALVCLYVHNNKYYDYCEV